MERLKLTGLWKNQARDGQEYFAGSLAPGVRVLIFKNGFKKDERDPDAVLYLAPSDWKKDGDSRPPEPAEPAKPVDPESLPF